MNWPLLRNISKDTNFTLFIHPLTQSFIQILSTACCMLTLVGGQLFFIVSQSTHRSRDYIINRIRASLAHLPGRILRLHSHVASPRVSF